ncbi:Uncharacterised protein [Mycobacterium tuberculosis]|nr:Uncharacterised protein [Mycobacterium tuberculosis]
MDIDLISYLKNVTMHIYQLLLVSNVHSTGVEMKELCFLTLRKPIMYLLINILLRLHFVVMVHLHLVRTIGTEIFLPFLLDGESRTRNL